jgi:hypothetical protein
MEETLEGGRGPPRAVVPLEREREREREREKPKINLNSIFNFITYFAGNILFVYYKEKLINAVGGNVGRLLQASYESHKCVFMAFTLL